MKNKQFIFLFLMLLGLVACTEKVAKELEETSTGPIAPPLVVMKTFGVDVEKVDEHDSTVMHKANELGSEKCKVEAPALDPNAPEIVDCVIDSGELDLYFNDLTFNATVSEKSMCEYIEYIPYAFYLYPTGKSNGNYYEIECAAGCETECANYNVSSYDGPTPANACLFDYTPNAGPNCDEGSFSVTTITFEYDSENEACFPTPMLATSNETCAGDNRNCLETPSKELIDIQNEDRFITKVNSDDFVQSYTLPKTIGSPHDTGTNLMVANFTKYCTGVSPAIQDVTGLDLSKFDQFTSPSSSEPAGFSFNITGGEVSTMSPLGGSRAQPLYRVRCLDRSHNIKAEIRFVIREWDIDYSLDPSPEEYPGLRLVREEDFTDVVGANQHWDLDDFLEYNGADDSIPNSTYFGNACYGVSPVVPYQFEPALFFRDIFQQN